MTKVKNLNLENVRVVREIGQRCFTKLPFLGNGMELML